MPKKLTHSEKVVKAVGRRPKTATEIGKKLGFDDHKPVARALGEAASKGTIVRTDDGKFQQA